MAGGIVLTEKQLEYVYWLADPDREGTKKAMAEKLGVTWDTLRKWERMRTFQEEMERRWHEIGVTPDRVAKVLDVLYKAAAGGDVQAAKLWLEKVDRVRPLKKADDDSDEFSELSDEDLEAILRG